MMLMILFEAISISLFLSLRWAIILIETTYRQVYGEKIEDRKASKNITGDF